MDAMRPLCVWGINYMVCGPRAWRCALGHGIERQGHDCTSSQPLLPIFYSVSGARVPRPQNMFVTMFSTNAILSPHPSHLTPSAPHLVPFIAVNPPVLLLVDIVALGCSGLCVFCLGGPRISISNCIAAGSSSGSLSSTLKGDKRAQKMTRTSEVLKVADSYLKVVSTKRGTGTHSERFAPKCSGEGTTSRTSTLIALHNDLHETRLYTRDLTCQSAIRPRRH